MANTTSIYYVGCLTAGQTGVYPIGITDPNGVIVQGVLRSEYAGNLTVAGAAVGNLTAAGNGGIVSTVNDTTVLPMPNVLLFGDKGYAITIVNESGQNDTVTIDFNLIDAVAFEA